MLDALPAELLAVAVAAAAVGLIALAKALGVSPADVRAYLSAFRKGLRGGDD